MLNLKIVAVSAALLAVTAPAFAQQADTPHQTMSEKFKAKRQQFTAKAKKAYFAVGCKILSAESASSLINAESNAAFATDQTAADTAKKKAEDAGMAKAAKPGQCDYFKQHPEEAEALKKAATN